MNLFLLLLKSVRPVPITMIIVSVAKNVFLSQQFYVKLYNILLY